MTLAPVRPATAWPLTPVGPRYDGASLLPDGRRLDDAVATEPDRLLGPGVHGRSGPRLPFALLTTGADPGPGVLRLRLDAAPACLTDDGPALLLCTEGAVRLTVAGEPLLLLPGRAAFVPAGLPVCATGPGVVVRATEPAAPRAPRHAAPEPDDDAAPTAVPVPAPRRPATAGRGRHAAPEGPEAASRVAPLRELARRGRHAAPDEAGPLDASPDLPWLAATPG